LNSKIYKLRSEAEAVEGSSLSLESVDDVQGGHGLSLGVFAVSDGVSDHGFQEVLENDSRVIVDEGRDSLDTSSAGESADSGLGDALDVSTGLLLGVSFSTNFSDTFSSFSCHFNF
jgi:hypothetical protein